MIQPNIIQEVLNTARIEEVVSEFVNLKKRGANYIGVCPFHNEKTPSFTVSPAKGLFKCFGCGKGGNAIGFVMEHEKLSYPEAVKFVAARYGIEIVEEAPSPEMLAAQSEQEALLNLNAFAEKFFQDQLQSDEGKAIGYSYLLERGFTQEIIEKFKIGYCPDSWDTFSKYALGVGYTADQLLKAGLCGGNADKLYDFFKGRIIFPIHNISGRTVAFTGRILKKVENTGKYVNSPETTVFQKRQILYALHLAKTSIAALDQCFLVEGQADVIAMHQAGIDNTVASSGTALTSEQIRLIRRYTHNITVLYDGDPAGIKASLRAVDLIVEEGMNVKLVLIPDGDDPDSFLKKRTPEEFKDFLKKEAVDFIQYKTRMLMQEIGNDPIRKADMIKEIVTTISLIPNEITRSLYIKSCSRIMEVQEQILLNELNKLRRAAFRKKTEANESILQTTEVAPPQIIPDIQNNVDHPERELIRLLLMYGRVELKYPNPDNEKEEITKTVAEYVINELLVDDINFRDPFCFHIFQEFVKHFELNEILNDQYFINYSDTEMNQFIINLVTTPYELSENWREKHTIEVPLEDEHLKENLDFYIFTMKNDRIEELIKQKQKELAEIPQEELLLCLTDLNDLIQLRNQLAEKLGNRVIIK